MKVTMPVWFKRTTLTLIAAATLVPAGDLLAAELSLVSGLYRSKEDKVGGQDQGKETTINAGGRYADELGPRLFWFGEGDLTLKSYTAGSSGDSPSNSTGLTAGGGVRYYFNKLAETISPYAYGKGLFRNEKGVSRTPGSPDYTETETNGLFYSGHLGIRFSLDTDFFFEVETPFFESALFATTKTTRVNFTTAAGATTKTTTESETNKTELYANTTGAFSDIKVAIGMRL
jgi:hypothetical protein